MIEEYGSLSEDELLEEILQELEEETDLDPNSLDFIFEDEKLVVRGTLGSQEELENLVGVLENFVDPSDYELDVELATQEKSSGNGEQGEYESEPLSGDDFEEESLEEMEGDEMGFDDEEGFDDEDKW